MQLPNQSGDMTVLTGLVERIDRLGLEASVADFLKSVPAREGAAWVRELTDTRSGISRMLLSIPPHAKALVAGEQLAGASLALAAVCQEVVAVDRDLPRLGWIARWVRYHRFDHVQCMEIDNLRRLPFRDSTFDLAWIDASPHPSARRRSGTVERRAGVDNALLREVSRVVKANGQIRLEMGNRFGMRSVIPYWTRWLTGPRVGGLVSTRGDLARGLRRYGFAKSRFYAPYPDSGRAKRLVALDRDVPTFSPQSRSKKRTLWDRLTGHPWVFRHVCPSYVVVAERSRPGRALIHEVVEALGLFGDPFRIGPISISKTGMVLARARDRNGQDVLLRLPFSPVGVSRCKANARALRAIHDSKEFGAPLKSRVPRLLGQTVVRGQHATAESLLPGLPVSKTPARRAGDVWDSLCTLVIELAGAPSSVILPGDPERASMLGGLTERIFDHLQRDTDARALVDPLRALVAYLADQRIPLALAHGDCHPGNVLTTSEASVSGLVDWDRGYTDQFPLVDLLDFAVRAEGLKARQAVLPLRISAAWERRLTVAIERYGMNHGYLEQLQWYYALRRAADLWHRPFLNGRRRGLAMEFVQWLSGRFTTTTASDFAWGHAAVPKRQHP